MAELIAKSKAFRAERARQKETDLDILDDVDAEFADIRRSLQLAKGRNGERGAARLSSREAVGDDGFDAAAASLSRGGRGRAGDALPTPEELAEKERKRLEALEQLRLKRAREETRDPTAEERLEGIGGYRGRRLRQKLLDMDEGKEGGERGRAAPTAARDRRTGPASGDALEEDDWEGGEDDAEGAGGEFEDEESDEDVPHHLRGLSDYGGKLQRRQAEQAKGDHPLQVAFRETMGKVMEKYGLAEKETGAGEGSDEVEDDSGDGGEEDEGEEMAPKKDAETGREGTGQGRQNVRGLKLGLSQQAEPVAPAVGVVETPRPAEEVRAGGGGEKGGGLRRRRALCPSCCRRQSRTPSSRVLWRAGPRRSWPRPCSASGPATPRSSWRAPEEACRSFTASSPSTLPAWPPRCPCRFSTWMRWCSHCST